jgi:acetyl esterase/lipase
MMRIVLAALLLAFVAPAHAQEGLQLAFSDARKIDYPGEIVLGTGKGQPEEEWFRQNGRLQVRNVEAATLTPFLPSKAANTRAAVIVAPGGGFLGLAIEEEGYRVARWLSDHGIAAFVLKYRVLPTPADPKVFRSEIIAVRTAKGKASFAPPQDTPADAMTDGQAAIRYLRANASKYDVDPNRLGMMGFSAGAFLTLSVTLSSDVTTRPAFIAPIYGRMLPRDVPQNPPPMFAAMAADDGLFAQQGFGLLESWAKAGGKAEFHLFQNGGHGFGLGEAGTTTVDWIESFRRWLEVNGFQD